MDLDGIRKLLRYNYIDRPWQETYGHDINHLSNIQLREMFYPWTASYTAKKKMEFILGYMKKQMACQEGAILNIGCGTGSTDRFLAKNGTKGITGCDISSSAIACAEIIAQVEDLDIKYICTNFIEESSFQPDQFSIIIIESVLEHIIDYTIWLEKIASILMAGGICITIVPSILGAYSIIHDYDFRHFKWKSQPHDYHPGMHCNHFWLSDLIKEFHGKGLIIERIFKFQAFNTLIKILFKCLRLTKLYKFYTVFDYFFSKLLHGDIATRVVIFRKQ